MKNMQRYISLFFVAVLAIGTFSCKKDPEVNTERIRIYENEKQFSIDGQTISMNLSGSVSYSKAISKTTLWFGSTEDLSDAIGCDFNLQDTIFSITVADLELDTVYYYRFGVYRYSIEFDKEMEIGGMQTNMVSTHNLCYVPTVETGEVSHISQTSAVVAGMVVNDGGSAIVERGICWSTSHNPTTSGSHANSGTGMGGYTVNITGLTSNTTYYVRAYAINSQGTSYGTEVSFKTSENNSAPTVTTSQVTNITQTTATGGGNVTSDGGATVTERGICWSTSHNPTTSGSHANSGTGTGSYTVNMTGLTANTTYYVRAYAKNSEGTSYGTEVGFTTQQIPSYIISVAANPTNGGTVTGGGVYQQGQSCTITATANEGFSFTNWTEGDNVVSTNANYTFIVNNNRVLNANFKVVPPTPTGAISGLFSVSATQQVWFSQGNLQYIGSASTPYWKFADNQWTYLASFTGQNSSNTNVDRNWFGWGTSGCYTGGSYYMPYDIETAYPAYYQYGPSGEHDLTGEYANGDWGVYNPISNGGNTPNTWRTLSRSEWAYVLFNRTTASGIRFAKAIVNDVNGVVLLPDDWNGVTYSLAAINNKDANYNSNVINTSVWTDVLEPHGAVFLPAAGKRYLYQGENGYYWSVSSYNSYQAYEIRFFDTNIESHVTFRYDGCSVRLVRDAE